MICLQFIIPPVPQLLTVGHGFWQPGNQHFKRTFGVYDLLLVKRGTLYMTEDDAPYSIGPGDLLVLEPDKPHWGHLPCEEVTEIYWVHFVHANRAVRVEQEHIAWSALIDRGSDFDQAPSSLQYLYIPKRARIDLQQVTPILDAMNEIHSRLSSENAIRLHLLHTEFLAALQRECSRSETPSPSARVSRAAADYLDKRWRQPFDSGTMEEALHFQFDYITRCMKKHTGKTPLQYVLYLRLEEAQKLLSHTVLTIPEIGDRVGIGDPNYLVRLFTAKLGMTPGAYRKMSQGHW
ncbi:MAG: AraC family transcriptional regulator [Paenibacillaceae bacterium]|jgi:AraC-like DNA-binding protein|nr:AraC family transcriptional regulator [Paenibacillaceae bacterium]